MELICAALMFLFINTFKEVSPKSSPTGKQVVESLRERMSRLGIESEEIQHGQLCPRKIVEDTVKKHSDSEGKPSEAQPVVYKLDNWEDWYTTLKEKNCLNRR